MTERQVELELDSDSELNDLIHAPDTGGKEKPQTVTLPISDWEKMKSQNEKILKFLTMVVDKDGDSPQTKQSKKRKREVSDDEQSVETGVDDFDHLLEEMCKTQASESRPEAELNDPNESEIMNELEQDFDISETLGDEVADRIAKRVSVMAKGQMTEEKMKQKEREFKRPKNIETSVPKVNPEIWGLMEHSAKTYDLKSQRQQKLLYTANNALVVAWDVSLKMGVASEEQKKLIKTIAEASGLILKTAYDMSLDRRAKILSGQNVNRKYRKLASSNIPVTQWLFGDDLKSACADIDCTTKLGLAFTQSSRGQKYFPSRQYAPKNSEWRGRGRWNWNGKRGAQFRGRGRSQGRPFFSGTTTSRQAE
ncbi:uncharacterized protein [Littorina saxatilis]|uniref:uncharacterized protein n=1 Tax=Littorina saxatilis TaxID=31220 RepID=UPI0038B4E75D